MTKIDTRRVAAGQADTVTISVGGMTCSACATRIERRLNAMDGVDARVSYASERARVRFEGPVETSQLVDEIEGLGFDARLVDDGAPGAEQVEADRAVRALGRRLIVALVLFMPLCDASLAFWLFPEFRFPGWQWVLVILAAPMVTWVAWPFYRAALKSARHGATTMDTLVSSGILASTAWSIYAIFWLDDTRGGPPTTSIRHLPGGPIYFDVAAGVITFLLAGRFFEARWRRRSGSALRSLAAIGAREVTVVDASGAEQLVPAAALQVGDRFIVRPGQTVATDGVVEVGEAAIDRSAMTGESVPVTAGPGDGVLGGTISVDGRMVVRATSVGRDTQLAHMVRLVEDAQSQKAAVQRLADRISAVFVPFVAAISVGTLLAWLASGASAQRSFTAALSVLIIACPCALGLATPTALLVASGQGARLGIFFKSYQALEASRRIDTVLLDKTGTLTSGRMTVVGTVTVPGTEPGELLRLAGSVESASEHLVGRAIATVAAEAGPLAEVDAFQAVPGLGARGRVNGEPVVVGRRELLAGARIPDDVAAACARWEGDGWTAVLVGRNDRVVGAIALADRTKPTAAAAVAELRALGLRCILVTGDNPTSARAVGRAVGVDEVVAEVLPAEKVALIRRLQGEGRSVAMVGDGVNDGPALAAANLGLAVGSGTDVAVNAADLVIVRDDLRVVATAVELSRTTLRTIHQNLVWAFLYNLAAIPLAALGFLNPLIAGGAMVLSSTFVVLNSSRLRRFAPRTRPGAAGAVAPEPDPAGRAPAVEHGDDHRGPHGRVAPLGTLGSPVAGA